MAWVGEKVNEINLDGVQIGQKYSRLTVKSIKGRGGSIECLCDCGNIIITRKWKLLSSRVVSCGCKRRGISLIGKRFEKLLIIDSVKERTPSRGRKWLCLCDCGQKIILPGNHLVCGHTRSCGCKQSDAKDQIKIFKCGEISGTFFGKIRQSADIRDITFNISAEYIWNLFIKQDRRCALTGMPIYFGHRGSTRKRIERLNSTASLDRIDNSVGYEEGNVRWVHREINRMRGYLNDEEFKKYCSLVVNKNCNP